MRVAVVDDGAAELDERLLSENDLFVVFVYDALYLFLRLFVLGRLSLLSFNEAFLLLFKVFLLSVCFGLHRGQRGHRLFSCRFFGDKFGLRVLWPLGGHTRLDRSLD